MGTLQNVTWRAAVLGRWTAQILGTLMVLFFLAFFFGEGPPRLGDLTALETLQLLAMGGIFLGLAVSWKWEGLGGSLAVAGFLALVAISRTHLRLWALEAPAAIGVVHLLCWWRLHAGAPAHLAPWHLSRSTLLGLGGALAVFLLLCANEMFGQPPIMTPSLRPSENLVGTWAAIGPHNVELSIHPDAAVTGTVDGMALAAGRIGYGRSWFGKMMHWNADYVIRGRLPDRIFAAPLAARGAGLDGTLFLDNRPAMMLKLRKP